MDSSQQGEVTDEPDWVGTPRAEPDRVGMPWAEPGWGVKDVCVCAAGSGQGGSGAQSATLPSPPFTCRAAAMMSTRTWALPRGHRMRPRLISGRRRRTARARVHGTGTPGCGRSRTLSSNVYVRGATQARGGG